MLEVPLKIPTDYEIISVMDKVLHLYENKWFHEKIRYNRLTTFSIDINIPKSYIITLI